MTRGSAALALRAPDALAGIALVIGASACFAALDTTTKWVSAAVPLLMALWFRYVFQAVATTIVVLPLRGRAVWTTRRLPWHLLRERRGVQATRTISCSEFAAWLTPDLDSPFLGRAARLRTLRWAMRAYWRAVLRGVR